MRTRETFICSKPRFSDRLNRTNSTPIVTSCPPPKSSEPDAAVRDKHVPWQVRSPGHAPVLHRVPDDFHDAHRARNEGSLIRGRQWTQRRVHRDEMAADLEQAKRRTRWHLTRGLLTKRSFTMMCPLLIIRSHVMRHLLKMPTQMQRNFDTLRRHRRFFPRDFITTVILCNDYINMTLSDLDASFTERLSIILHKQH